ncbi:MAG: MarR family winged helix-turn-helix transcriptional regulator [Solirubrobacteraceae bacterium]
MTHELPVHASKLEPREHPGRVLARLTRQVELALVTADLTLPQYRVLILLCEHKEEASVLADKLAVSRPTVTGVVDGLVARDLVQRQQDPDDRRRVCHRLTAEGRRLLVHADAEVEQRLCQIAELRPGGAGDVFAGLGSWQEAMDAHRARCACARAASAATVAAVTVDAPYVSSVIPAGGAP